MVYREVSMIEIKEILLRIVSKSSIRNISDSLGIHRDTIKNYIALARKHGFDPCKDSKDMITDELIQKIKSSISISKNKNLLIPGDELLLPHKETIEKYLKSGLKGSKIIVLLSRQGIAVTKASFYRFLRNSCESYNRKNITVRLPEVDPGLYCQADFGRLGKIWDKAANKLRVVWALVITLCYSRHMFIYITFKQDMTTVIAGFEAAWAYFGGITELVIVDNPKTIIDRSDRCDPKINKTFLEYAQYRQFIIDPANVAHPRGKPIVERGVPYVRDNFFAGETFLDINDCQDRATAWCSFVAGTRVHGSTGKVPIVVFEEIEKDKLIAYAYDRYDIALWAICKVHPDHHIRFRNSLYSLPTKYIGKHVEVRGDSALVKIYHAGNLIKVHKTVAAGKRSTDFNDYPAELTPYTLRNPNYQIKEGYKKDPAIGSYIEQILTGPYPWHRLRSAQKILRLADKYGAGRMAAALTKAKAYSIYDMRRIENMLKNGVEADMPMLKETPVQLKIEELKFLRDSFSFNHYKDN
jgi:hypothetical protein